jgi:hypothetical protein
MGLLTNYGRTVRGGAYVPPSNRPTAMSRMNIRPGAYVPPAFAEQQQNYVIPSRIAPLNVLDEFTGNAAGFIGEAMTLPAKIIEAPVAFVNQGIKSLTGALFGGPGIDVAGGIGASPVGGIFKGAGDLVDTVSNFVPALINSTDTNFLYKYRDQTDDFVIPDWGETTEGPPILGMFGIGGSSRILMISN